MKPKTDQPPPPPTPSIVDDKATDRLKQRLQDWGLIVNARAGKPARPTSKKKGGKTSALPRP